MDAPAVRFLYDYVDPGSYLAHRILSRAVERRMGGLTTIVHHPFELSPHPRPLIDPRSARWSALSDAMERQAERMGVSMDRPPLIPWSRKAHELAMHARARGCFDEVHQALFEAHFTRGEDIGRVDTLVNLASRHGMDSSETRTVLDVDRYVEAVEEERRAALEMGVRGVPTLIVGDWWLEGFQDRESLERFLADGARSRAPRGSSADDRPPPSDATPPPE